MGCHLILQLDFHRHHSKEGRVQGLGRGLDHRPVGGLREIRDNDRREWKKLEPKGARDLGVRGFGPLGEWNTRVAFEDEEDR